MDAGGILCSNNPNEHSTYGRWRQDAGWKGRGAYATCGADAAWYVEGDPVEPGTWSSSRSGPTRWRTERSSGDARAAGLNWASRPVRVRMKVGVHDAPL